MDKSLETQMSAKRAGIIHKDGQYILNQHLHKTGDELYFLEIGGNPIKKIFDEALDNIHYAGSCQRVGRCMRLAVIIKKTWVGGIVLGSPFPNIDARDRFLGLKKYVMNFRERGLKNPWSHENKEYWVRLQGIVNHARTFIFPSFQGQGIGIKAHQLLLSSGIELWEKKYQNKVGALDTLCDHGDSRLFLANGWTLVGETKGYCSNPKSTFSKRTNDKKSFKNSVALMKSPDNTKWVIWVKKINPSIFS